MSLYELFISFRYLRAKRKQMFVSVVTFFSVAGITLGVAALIIVLSVMNGFESELREKIINVNSHIVCMDYTAPLANYDKVMNKINEVEGVVATTPFIYGQAMIRSGQAISGVVVRGINTETFHKVVKIGKMRTGKIEFLELSKRNGGQFPVAKKNMQGVVVGKELAKSVGISLFDTLTMLSPVGINTPLGTMPTMKNFVVVGVFDSGFYDYDASLVYMSLAESQSFFAIKNAVTGIEIKVDDIYRAQDIANKIESKLGYPFHTRHWMEMNKNLFSALKMEKIVMFIILSLIILVAAFNIITSLIMV
ncbi:MAG: ABC transporter permease, partial [Deltaproteobacteria bacterium]